MKYILSFSVVSLLVHDSSVVISLEILDPQGKLYNSRQKHRQSILQFLSSQPKRAHLENRCLREYPNENSNTSQLRLDLLLESKNMASSDKTDSGANPPTLPSSATAPTPATFLRVEYDYEYDYKTRKVSVKQGEILGLLQKTNEHWWKVVRPGINKPFFVPAQYVSPHENGGTTELSETHNERKHEKNEITAEKTVNEVSSSVRNRSSNINHNSNNNESFEAGRSRDEQYLTKDTGSDRRPFTNQPSISKVIKIGRNEATRSSHRDKVHSKMLTSSSTKISSSPGNLKNWSASLEELSKQIVFPGLTSESVADLTNVHRKQYSRESKAALSLTPKNSVDLLQRVVENGSESDSINKCLSFRNPSYSSQTTASRNQLMEDVDFSPYPELGEDNSFHVPRVKVMEGSKSKHDSMSRNNLPEIPSPSTTPVRVLTDNWAEYFSSKCSRYFYYNSLTNVTSWKPPRNSPVKKPEDNLGSSLSDASAHASSFEKSLENIPDLVGNNTSFSKRDCQTECSAWGEQSQSAGVFLKSSSGSNNNLSLESVSSIKLQSEDECSNAESLLSSQSVSIPIPEGWETQWDELTQQICYVNKNSGEKWFSSTDAQERIYFYKENSNNSSWFLPRPESSITQSQSHSSTSKSLETDSHEECDTVQTYPDTNPVIQKYGSVMKRHSAGEVADRNNRAKSLHLPNDRRLHLESPKSGSLPRVLSIWAQSERPTVLKEGVLARTKITENGKKLRKSWGQVYAVLTESHLSLFRDQKSYNSSNSKTDAEIDLRAATVEWTEDKSRRNNVFQLTTHFDLQMLFQVDDKDKAEEWYQDIKRVTDKSEMGDISMRFRSTESPENMLDSNVIGERKISSGLIRNKSTKYNKPKTSNIKAHLNKFFNRRPPRESLIKKGIYKDESVFGCSLGKLCELEKSDVPKFIEECILAIESKEENLKTDGIYRASGNLSQVQKIRLQVDQNKLEVLFQEEDVHVLAGCLKLFFRELKEPLIPYELYEKALLACNSHNKKEKDKLNKFREVIASLARPNKCTLQKLLKHLLKVAEFSEFNRMQIPNLAIVFGPTLMWPAVESQNMALDLMQQNLVIEKLLLEYESIFQ